MFLAVIQAGLATSIVTRRLLKGYKQQTPTRKLMARAVHRILTREPGPPAGEI